MHSNQPKVKLTKNLGPRLFKSITKLSKNYQVKLKRFIENPAIKRLIELEYEYNGENKGTLLHWAVDLGNNGFVSDLIKFGADVNARNKDGQTPLQLAAKKLCKESIHILLRSGANPNLYNSWWSKSPFEMVDERPIFPYDLVRSISNQSDPFRHTDPMLHNDLSFHKRDHIDYNNPFVKRILEDYNNPSPGVVARIDASFSMMRLLIAYGAKPKFDYKKDSKGVDNLKELAKTYREKIKTKIVDEAMKVIMLAYAFNKVSLPFEVQLMIVDKVFPMLSTPAVEQLLELGNNFFKDKDLRKHYSNELASKGWATAWVVDKLLNKASDIIFGSLATQTGRKMDEILTSPKQLSWQSKFVEKEFANILSKRQGKVVLQI
jgi:hypothetical protein